MCARRRVRPIWHSAAACSRRTSRRWPAFTASLTAEGLSAEAFTGAGIAAQRQGMLGTAREYLEHARKLAPRSAIAHGNLGIVRLAQKDYHDARSAFRSAMALSDGDGDEALRRNLERAEMAIAARESGAADDPAATRRVVRLGSDSFRLTEKPGGGDNAETPAAAGTHPASAGVTDDASAARTGLVRTGADKTGAADGSGDEEAGPLMRPLSADKTAESSGKAGPAGSEAADGMPATGVAAGAVEAGTGSRTKSGIPAPIPAVGKAAEETVGGTAGGTAEGAAEGAVWPTGTETAALAGDEIEYGAR